MRLIVDATPVRAAGGGLSTYADGLLRAWSRAFPNDQLIVVAGSAEAERLMRDVAGDVRVAPLRSGRFVAQHGLIPLLTRSAEPEAILALVPTVPIVPSTVPMVSVVHDMRAWMHPEEFPVSVRIYRRTVYHHAFHRSARLIAVSERSRRDLAEVCRRSEGKTHVVHPAADHVDAWAGGERAPHVITFGHWTNKKPRMAIEAWASARASASRGSRWELHVVGVPEARRETLIGAAADLGVEDSVVVHAYLPDLEYQRLFTSASAVLMLSTFEGFGLPVVEAMRRGVHVIASRDAALVEAGGRSAAYVDDKAGLSRALCDVMNDRPQVRQMVRSGLEWTRGMTWAASAAGVRDVIQQAIG